jgi:hypothetical protein
MTDIQYDEMLKLQGGACACCKQSPKGERLAVDHDHRTGIVRALLCRRCNLVLGKVHDDSDLLSRLAEYVELHRGLC